MPRDNIVLGLPGYEILEMKERNRVEIWVRYTRPTQCPHCGSGRLRKKALFIRKLRHGYLHLEARKYKCLDCGRYFNQRFPGILPRRRSTEAFRRQIFRLHYDGVCRKTLAERQRIGTATVERWFQDQHELEAAKLSGEPCPQVLGLDEHFFTRRKGYAATLCDLKHHKIYDVVLGRSEASLEAYFLKLLGKDRVRGVCIDLASNYRALIRKHFPNAKIVADRFPVIRLVNFHFLAAWRAIDPEGSRDRGLLSLMRQHEKNIRPKQQQRLARYLQAHPELEPVYAFKQKLCQLLLSRHCHARKCRQLIPQLRDLIDQLKTCGLEQFQQLGRTLEAWREEIACMWRFTKNNGITEGFHNKMEMISRRAFGFRNFENYRLRVRVMCA